MINDGQLNGIARSRATASVKFYNSGSLAIIGNLLKNVVITITRDIQITVWQDEK
jgi:hypothetical protein